VIGDHAVGRRRAAATRRRVHEADRAGLVRLLQGRRSRVASRCRVVARSGRAIDRELDDYVEARAGRRPHDRLAGKVQRRGFRSRSGRRGPVARPGGGPATPESRHRRNRPPRVCRASGIRPARPGKA
jgi:hypothetical protein